jgi:FkbM family methyltransferase
MYTKSNTQKIIFFIKVLLLNKCQKKVLVLLLNLLSKKDLRFFYINGDYFVIENSVKHFFIKERYTLYLDGAISRSLNLAGNYGLDSIVFEDKDVVIDVGANNGDLISYFKNQTYIGFEPSLVEFKLLSKNNLYGGSIYNYAVGNSNKEIDFFISSKGANSSMVEPVEFTHQNRVIQIRLDEFCVKKIKLLKIDAEGAEIEVLQGCEKILNLIEYISVDAGFERGINSDMTAPQVFDFLYQNNFRLIGEPSYTRYLFKNYVELIEK